MPASMYSVGFFVSDPLRVVPKVKWPDRHLVSAGPFARRVSFTEDNLLAASSRSVACDDRRYGRRIKPMDAVVDAGAGDHAVVAPSGVNARVGSQAATIKAAAVGG